MREKEEMIVSKQTPNKLHPHTHIHIHNKHSTHLSKKKTGAKKQQQQQRK